MKKKSNCAWLKLDYNFMTDESEYEDEDGQITVHQHFLPWRSQSTGYYSYSWYN